MYESSWRSKGKRILCYDKDPNSNYIITDVLVIRDDEQVPDGFSGIFLTEDTSIIDYLTLLLDELKKLTHLVGCWIKRLTYITIDAKIFLGKIALPFRLRNNNNGNKESH